MNKESLIQYAMNALIAEENFNDIDRLFSKDYIAHLEDKQYEFSVIKKWSKQMKSTFSNLKVSNLIFFTETEDTVVWQRTLKGKHIQSIRGIPASGKIIQWNEMIVSRFFDGKIKEEWIVSELVGKLLLKVKK